MDRRKALKGWWEELGGPSLPPSRSIRQPQSAFLAHWILDPACASCTLDPEFRHPHMDPAILPLHLACRLVPPTHPCTLTALCCMQARNRQSSCGCGEARLVVVMAWWPGGLAGGQAGGGHVHAHDDWPRPWHLTRPTAHYTAQHMTRPATVQAQPEGA